MKLRCDSAGESGMGSVEMIIKHRLLRLVAVVAMALDGLLCACASICLRECVCARASDLVRVAALAQPQVGQLVRKKVMTAIACLFFQSLGPLGPPFIND
jgi:hypothetical protein